MQGIKPLKRLGQNFLIDKNVVKKVIKTANIKPQDIVLEIGPGLGALTLEIAKRAGKVIAVEKDRRMCEVLKENLKGFKNIEIIQGDILKIQNSKFKIQNYKLVANLPFYITAPVIRKFLESENPPKEMVLIVQKEVAQRICAKPPRMSILAVSVQFYGKPEIISYVSKRAFWPQPKVDAAIIRITPFNPLKKFAWAHSHFASPKRASAFRMLFFKVVKAGFSHPRKQLANNLAKGLALSLPNGLKLNKDEVNKLLLQNNIQPSQRAETLTLNDWIKLSKVI